MRNFNVNPYFRSSVGFDNFLNSALNSQKSSSLPYNIVKKSDDDYSISLALAGWNESDLTITKDKNTRFCIHGYKTGCTFLIFERLRKEWSLSE